MVDQIITRAEAKEQGLTHYYTGVPCKNGHILSRYVKSKACIECAKSYNTKWLKENPERASVARKNWKKLNSKQWQNFVRIWTKKNRGYLNYRERSRQAKKLNASPHWVDLNKIKQIYSKCPVGYEVDHIVPLQSKTVCGLHVACNLQYLPIKENRSKGNRYWPNMW